MLNFCSFWDFQLAQCLFSRQNKMLAVIEIQVSGLILFCWWKLFIINLGNHTCHAIIAITHQTSRACSRNHCKTWKVAMMESIRPSQRYKMHSLSSVLKHRTSACTQRKLERSFKLKETQQHPVPSVFYQYAKSWDQGDGVISIPWVRLRRCQKRR